GVAPPFSLPALNDAKLITSADLAGKVALIDLWRSDCPRCPRHVDALVALRRKFSDRGFEILGVSDENRDPRANPIAAAVQFARDHGVEYPLALSDGGEFHAGYYQRVTGMPSTYLVRRNGELDYLGVDATRPEYLPALEALIDRRLNEPAGASALRAPEGKPLPDFTLISLRGGPIRSSDLRGQPALIALLLPSLTERHGATLSALATQYGPRGLRVIGVVFGAYRDVVADADARRPAYEVAFPDAETQRALVGADYLPKFLFVSRDGTVLKTITNVYGRERGVEPFVFDRYAALLVGGATTRPKAVEASASTSKPSAQAVELGFTIEAPQGFREAKSLEGSRVRYLGPGSEEVRVAVESRFGSDARAVERAADAAGEGLDERRIDTREWTQVAGTRGLVLQEGWSSPLGTIRAVRVLVPCAEGVLVATASAPLADYARDGAELKKSALSLRAN
ncbi:MAG TPA: redoxin domain-containing protein, partial [Planctomycetota bacterium]|nr:redoxin domain-containing protein [Planctomycetota bacterium]